MARGKQRGKMRCLDLETAVTGVEAETYSSDDVKHDMQDIDDMQDLGESDAKGHSLTA